jgi:VanZ family protein
MALLRRFRAEPRWRWGLWLVLTTLWTVLLVFPMPDEVGWPVTITGGLKFYIGKSLHFGMYTGLTILAGWLLSRWRWRLLLLFFLMAHAGVTELAQMYVPGRTGRVEDVVLDHAGVLVGLFLSWRWWARED